LTKSKFRVGDRIKLTAIPQSVLDMQRSDKYRPHSTLNACKYLLRTNRARIVVEVDRDSGWLWIRFRYRERNGKVAHCSSFADDRAGMRANRSEEAYDEAVAA
jgi:hypothetical protein